MPSSTKRSATLPSLTDIVRINMCPSCFVSILAILLAGGIASAAPIEASIQAAADYSRSNGGQTLVVLIDGKLVFEAYDNGGAADQLQALVSGVKGFVGVAAVAAVQAGLIRLDDPVSEGIPAWKDDPLKATITYRQLLNMTSGLTHTAANEGGISPSWKEMADKPMAAKPGERFRYG